MKDSSRVTRGFHIPVASNEKHDGERLYVGYMSAARSIKRHYTGTRLPTSGSLLMSGLFGDEYERASERVDEYEARNDDGSARVNASGPEVNRAASTTGCDLRSRAAVTKSRSSSSSSFRRMELR